MRSLLNLILVIDLLFLGIIYRPLPAQAAPRQPDMLSKTSPSLGGTSTGPDCLLYPMTAKQTVIDSAAPGDTIDILGGFPELPAGNVDRGWLAWDPQWLNVSDLEAELQYPQLSLSNYTNPLDPDDHILNTGDYVASLPGNNNSTTTRAVLHTLVGQEIIIPVWDNFSLPYGAYQISSFARVRIDSPSNINLTTSNPTILATYLGPVTVEQCPYLSLTKSGPVTATVERPITYTLTLTNSGNLTATNLVITDAIPAYATYVDGGTRVGKVVSWTIPSLSVGSSLTRMFTVTATRTITNKDYRAGAEGNISTTGDLTVTTVISPDLTITKTGPVTATAGSPVTYSLVVTNQGGLATNMVITDTLPAHAVYVSGGTLVGSVVSWTIPILEFGESLSRTFSLTSTNLTIINSDYGVSADGDVCAMGSISVVTALVPDDRMSQFYLPLILKE